MVRVAAVIVVLTGVGWAPGVAAAGTLTYVGDRLEYRAAPGEANAIAVAADRVTGVNVSDLRGVAIGTGAAPHCTRENNSLVYCSRPLALVEAGDGNDRVVSTLPVPVDGGPGNDVLSGPRLTGGDGDDALDGGTAADQLAPGPGADRVVAGDGDDVITLAADAGQRDEIDGGAGVDALDYSGSGGGVRIDLETPAASDDAIVRAERLVGSPRDDTLRGSVRPETIEGGGGLDRIDARDGDDHIVLAGAGTVSAGNGADRIDLDTGAFDAAVDAGDGPDTITGMVPTTALRCGDGRDAVSGRGGRPPGLVGRDCEGGAGRPAVRRARGGLRLAVPCPDATAGVRRCTVVARVRDRRGRVIARTRHRFRPSRGARDVRAAPPATLVLRLSRRPRGRVRVEVHRTASTGLWRTVERGVLRTRLR